MSCWLLRVNGDNSNGNFHQDLVRPIRQIMSADWRLCALDCIFLLYVNLVTEGKPLSASVAASHPWHLALRMRPHLRQSIPAVISSRLPSIPARAFLLVFGEALAWCAKVGRRIQRERSASWLVTLFRRLVDHLFR
mmetsp:Transcript_15826/g.23324  ORF Transcript_15826/g.23324 Transcript_15826/m.23324 type:complete len:136 (+) Transcript_15826:303-710(+)